MDTQLSRIVERASKEVCLGLASKKLLGGVAGLHHQGSNRHRVPGLQELPVAQDPRCTPRRNPACRGTFGGRRKAVRDRFALQGRTLDFP